jgi:DNA-binding transcriptional regulator YiaG
MKTIKDICIEYGLSQTALAKRFGIPLRTVQDWHSGRRVPPEYVVSMMIEILERERQA